MLGRITKKVWSTIFLRLFPVFFFLPNTFWDLEKEMATHSSVLAWRVPWTEEPGWLQFMVSQRVGYNWAHAFWEYTIYCLLPHRAWRLILTLTLASMDPHSCFAEGRRAWQPTPVFWPGESPGIEPPGRLQSMGLQRVKPNWLSTANKREIRKWTLMCVIWLLVTKDCSRGPSCLNSFIPHVSLR